MGYTSEVRFMTTEKGFEKIKELATKKYNELLGNELKEGEKDEKWSRDGDVCIKKNGLGTIYREKLPLDYEVLNKEVEGFVMFGWNCVKWLGYDHLERKAYNYACENCGEYVRCVMVGEDGAIEEEEWNSEKDDGSMPYVCAYTRIDDDAWC